MTLGDDYGRWHDAGGDLDSARPKIRPELGLGAPEQGAPMSDVKTVILPERRAGRTDPHHDETLAIWRLGRHLEHDEASRAFPAERSSHLHTVLHDRWAPILDQGQVGSCTGNALTGVLGTAPFVPKPGVTPDETLALTIYEKATALDSIPGVYPPDDTGSSGLAVAKAARQLGLISSYRHAFGLAHALAALVLRPVIIGINWYASFDTPAGPAAELVIGQGAQVRGGHEVELVGIDVTAGIVHGCNSWGTGWGDQGRFTMAWGTLDRLLAEGGDCTAVHP